MTDLINISSFMARQDAEMAKGILEENGIKAFIKSDDLAGLRPHLSLTDGVILLVAKEDLVRAQEALEVLKVPLADYHGDEELEFFKLKQNAASFPVLVITVIAEVIAGCWFLWHSLFFAGIAFLVLAAVFVVPCRTTYKARQEYNAKNR